MNRSSNLILGFVLAVAGILVAYGLGRMFFQVIQSPEVELEENSNYQSQLKSTQNVLLQSIN